MLYQTELPAHNDIIKAFLRDRELSGLAPRTHQFYHEKLEKLRSQQCVLQLRKGDIQELLYSLTCNQGGKQAYLRAFKSFFNWVENNDLVPLSATRPCKNLKKSSKTIDTHLRVRCVNLYMPYLRFPL